MLPDEPAASVLPDGWLGLDMVSPRRAIKRSVSDPREELLCSEEMLGADACGVDLVVLSAPIRPPMLSVPLGLPSSEGCGKVLR